MPRDPLVLPDLSRFAERQLRSWEIGRAQRTRHPDAVADVLDFVTISNHVGAGGREIAEALGERLAWPVFDRNLLQLMAGDDDLRAQRYASLDERTMGWLEGIMRFLLDQSFVRNDYLSRLRATVMWLARQEHCIFLGRFADLILPEDRGIRIKVIAPPERCVANFARHAGTSLEEARLAVDRIERERAEFVSSHFRDAPDEHARFDLLINSERFATSEAVDLIVQAMEMRGCRPLAQSPESVR